MIIESYSMEETKRIGVSMGVDAKASEIYCLSGDLGVGKTVFSKGFAEGLRVCDEVTSPTFTIINEYEGRLPFYHFDVYRITSLEEMEDTGVSDYLYGDGVCLLEWAELVKEIIPDNACWITIEKDFSKGDDYRKIEIIRE